MKIDRQTVVWVTGAGSGLGLACVAHFAALGAKVVAFDQAPQAAEGMAIQCNTVDVSDAQAFAQCAQAATEGVGVPRVLLHVAGIGTAKRILDKTGQAAPLADFERVIRVNLVGSYNVVRCFAQHCAQAEPLDEDGHRGVVVLTASVAAFDGQVGQEAYSASKAGVVGMTLPLARDLAQWGIRVNTIAPGLFATPLMKTLPETVQAQLAQSIPFPKRLGQPEEFAQLTEHLVINRHLNGEVIRLDGALRLAPR